MNPPPPNIRFTIRDALVWMAAIAGGFGIARAVWMANETIMSHSEGNVELKVYWRFGTGVTAVSALVFMLTCAHFVSWIWADRRPLRAKLAVPGFIATFVVLLAGCYQIIVHAPTWVWVATGHHSSEMGWIDARLVFSHVVEQAPKASLVLSAWAIQWTNNRFRPEPTWLDRSGRCLAAYWILLPLVWLNIATFYFR